MVLLCRPRGCSVASDVSWFDFSVCSISWVGFVSRACQLEEGKVLQATCDFLSFVAISELFIILSCGLNIGNINRTRMLAIENVA